MMGFIDNLLKGLKNAVGTSDTILTSSNMVMNEGSKNEFKIVLKNKKEEPLPNKTVNCTIIRSSDNAKKTYELTTDDNGVGKLSINLSAGKYTVNSSFNTDGTNPGAATQNTILVYKSTEITSVNMTDPQAFSIYLTDMRGNPIKGETINFRLYRVSDGKYKDYSEITGDDGKASLTIGLSPGDYKIQTSYEGSDIYRASIPKMNMIVISPKTVINSDNDTGSSTSNTTKTETFNLGTNGCWNSPRFLSNGEMAQDTLWFCALNSIQQCWWELTKRFVKESSIAKIAGTTQTGGTGHDGINAALNYLAKKDGVKINIEWKYFSDVGWEQLGEYIADPKTAVFIHSVYRLTWGHYEYPYAVCPKNKIIKIANSLSGGYLQNRPYATMLKYINAESQPSICVVSLV